MPAASESVMELRLILNKEQFDLDQRAAPGLHVLREAFNFL
jgi:hypothetical protein